MARWLDAASVVARELWSLPTKDNRWFFVFGFEKNQRVNISDEELEGLQSFAADLLPLTGRQLDEAVADGALREICQ